MLPRPAEDMAESCPVSNNRIAASVAAGLRLYYRKIGVSGQLLNCPSRRTAYRQMTAERMPQDMNACASRARHSLRRSESLDHPIARDRCAVR
jgi:hypothetical protein